MVIKEEEEETFSLRNWGKLPLKKKPTPLSSLVGKGSNRFCTHAFQTDQDPVQEAC